LRAIASRARLAAAAKGDSRRVSDLGRGAGAGAGAGVASASLRRAASTEKDSSLEDLGWIMAAEPLKLQLSRIFWKCWVVALGGSARTGRLLGKVGDSRGPKG